MQKIQVYNGGKKAMSGGKNNNLKGMCIIAQVQNRCVVLNCEPSPFIVSL